MLGSVRGRLRPMERFFAAPFLWLRVPPNAVTLLSVAPAAAAAWMVAQRWWIPALFVGGVASLLDFVDGTVARARGRVTPFGGYLDSVTDRVVDLLFLFGLGFALESRAGWALVGLGAIGSVGTSYARARLYQDARPPEGRWGWGIERPERILILGVGVLGQGLAEWRGVDAPILLACLGLHAAGSLATFVRRVLLARRVLAAAA